MTQGLSMAAGAVTVSGIATVLIHDNYKGGFYLLLIGFALLFVAVVNHIREQSRP